MQDIRAYRFIVTQYSKDPPEAWKVFPLLAGPELRPIVNDEDALAHDDLIFHSVTASLSKSKGE